MKWRYVTTMVVIAVLVYFVDDRAINWFCSFQTKSNTDEVRVGGITFYTNSRKLHISAKAGSGLTAFLGDHLANSPSLLSLNLLEDKAIFNWTNGLSLSIAHLERSEADCYAISWLAVASPSSSLQWPTDCFQFSFGHWFGGPELFRQHWPMQNLSIPMQPYISKDIIGPRLSTAYGSFVERYFLNSQGLSIIVKEDTPFWLSVNENNNDKMCFAARYSDSEYPRKGRRDVSLKYDICVSHDIKDVHTFSMSKYFAKPNDIPDERMFRHPIWSTWAKFKNEINQTLVVEFAKAITDKGFKNSQLEIDDMWAVNHGDLNFDTTKFPDPKQMVDSLHSMGFRVALWTHPFANTESKILQNDLQYRWVTDGLMSSDMGSQFVQSAHGTPALVKWWNGFGALVDFTNSVAAQKFIDRHFKLKNTFGVDSFKFDAGEAAFVPTALGTHSQVTDVNAYTTSYVESVAVFGGIVEVRSGYMTQHLPIFVRMMDKDSVWSHFNGLRSLIPTCLTLGIVGYPFILSDMIGGNGYERQVPDEELFVRWLELTAFLPAMQFSVVPWEYEDPLVMEIARKYVKLHAEYVTPLILRFAQLATREDGATIIRPIWWVSPKDEAALTVDDEFLIGDEVLVAPVVRKGARKRDIYLPGPSDWQWKDERTEKIYGAGIWLKNFPVQLDEVAYFKAMKPKD